MAVMIASKRASVSKLLERLLAAGPSARAFAPSAFRSFNTNAQQMVETDDERAVDVSRRRSRRRGEGEDYPSLFPDVFSPFNSTRSSLSQVLNLMDQLTGSGLPVAARRRGGGIRRGWDAHEDADALHLRIDMPGLGKEHVKVSAEQNTLIIRGEGGEEEADREEEESGRRYSSRIDLPEGLYKMDAIKAEMKNGVLKVAVPKVKQEERKDVFDVKIE